MHGYFIHNKIKIKGYYKIRKQVVIYTEWSWPEYAKKFKEIEMTRKAHPSMQTGLNRNNGAAFQE